MSQERRFLFPVAVISLFLIVNFGFIPGLAINYVSCSFWLGVIINFVVIFPRIFKEKRPTDNDVIEKREVPVIPIPYIPQKFVLPVFITSFFITTSSRDPQWVLSDFLGLVVGFIGFCITLWSRYHLGKHWTGDVLVTKQHELIQSGPYAMVRHPMYTGLNTMCLGCALSAGFAMNWSAILSKLAWLVIFNYNDRKSKSEEEILGKRFGKAWDDYKKKVPYRIYPGVL